MKLKYNNMRSDGVLKQRKRCNGTLRMRQVVLHPLVWRTLMRKRQTPKNKGRRRHAKAFRRSRSSSSSSKTLAVDQLDSGVWKYLPQELTERILDRLPLPCVIASRTVCKTWNDHIMSTLLPSATLPKKTVVVYFPQEGDFSRQPLTVYNACRNEWDRHDMSFLHDEGVLGSYSLVAADKGLLCFCDTTWTTFVVCNPLSKQWRVLRPPTSVLPHIPRMQVAGCPGNYILVGLVVDDEDDVNYKLVLAGLIPKMVTSRRRVLNLSHTHQERQSRTTFVYDSRFRSWNPAPALPLPPLQLDFGVWCNECPRRSVTSKGKLYWSIVERNEDDIPVREVVRFDVATREWCDVALEDHNVRDLVELNGKVLAVKLWDGMRVMVRHIRGGGLRAFYANVGVEVASSDWESRMFEVQEDTDAGDISLKKRRIPKLLQDAKMSEKATSAYDNQYSCIGQGTSLFVMHQVIDGDIHCEWEMQGWKVLHFDSSKDSCVRLPQLNTYLHEQFPLSWWTLRPSLAALV